MTIRKTGAADGRITEAGAQLPVGEDGDGIVVTAASPAPWGPQDEDALEAENEADGLG